MDDRDPPSAAPDLQARIDEARRKAAPPPPKPSSPKAIGMRAGVELFAGVAAGLIVGIMLDRWLGTASLWMDTAGAGGMSPPLRIRYLPVEEARALYAQLGRTLAARRLRW